jgi:flagellar secretion chaperone FliS
VSYQPHGDPYRIYREQQVTGLGTGRLVLLAYETALRACRRGQRGLLTKVLHELIAGLDLEQGEVAAGLLLLYEYSLRLAREGRIEEVGGILQELRDTWEAAVRIEERASSQEGPHPAAQAA